MVQSDRILVVGPSWVGDMVMAQTLFRTLKALAPNKAIDVLAPAWSQPLLARMPEVDEGLDLPFAHGELALGRRRALGIALRSRHYGQAIVLPNSLKSALIPFCAGIPKRTGWRGEMRYGLVNDLRVLDKARHPLMIQRFAALAYPEGADLPKRLPWPQLRTDARSQQHTLGRLGLSLERPVLAFCPGAEFGSSKRWPAEYYALVAKEIISKNWQLWIFGSVNDRDVATTIASQLPKEMSAHCHNLAGVTELAEAIDLLAFADAVVSNDSGLMHIAGALQRPMVVIYGSTSPGFTPPLTENVRVLSEPVDCGPCFQRECPQGHLKCQYGVGPERVLAAINELSFPLNGR